MTTAELSREPIRPIAFALLARSAALASRYGALAAQFVLTVLVVRYLTKAESGVYLLAFGAVTTLSVYAGFGTPDGLIKAVAELIEQGRRDLVRSAVMRSAGATLASAVLLAILLVGIGLASHRSPIEAALMAGWFLAYACVFFCGQALVALGNPQLGAFAYYALNNIVMFCTTVPYLALTRGPRLDVALGISVSACGAAGVASMALVWRALRRHPAGDGKASLAESYRLGFIIASARMFQSALYWIPAWIAASVRGSADAAVLGAAGRLLIAATAVIAVFRFTLRSRIVTATARGDRAQIERMARAAATVATLWAVAALLGTIIVGRPVIGAVFGPGFAGAALVLQILLLGAIGESVGGPVDEVLKYNGYAVPVLIGLIVTVAMEAVIAWGIAHVARDSAMIAFAQAVSFCGMYAFQILLCRRRIGVTILPYLRPAEFRAAMREKP